MQQGYLTSNTVCYVVCCCNNQSVIRWRTFKTDSQAIHGDIIHLFQLQII